MHAGRQRGFTYVGVMAVVAILGIGLAAIGPMWSDDARRERERETLRIGQVYAQAISGYYHSSPGSVKVYPEKLEDLLLDNRFVGTRRWLRQRYKDPMTSRDWGLVRTSDGRIRGVYSESAAAPLRTEPIDLGITSLSAARTYSDWQFIPKVTP